MDHADQDTSVQDRAAASAPASDGAGVVGAPFCDDELGGCGPSSSVDGGGAASGNDAAAVAHVNANVVANGSFASESNNSQGPAAAAPSASRPPLRKKASRRASFVTFDEEIEINDFAGRRRRSSLAGTSSVEYDCDEAEREVEDDEDDDCNWRVGPSRSRGRHRRRASLGENSSGGGNSRSSKDGGAIKAASNHSRSSSGDESGPPPRAARPLFRPSSFRMPPKDDGRGDAPGGGSKRSLNAAGSKRSLISTSTPGTGDGAAAAAPPRPTLLATRRGSDCNASLSSTVGESKRSLTSSSTGGTTSRRRLLQSSVEDGTGSFRTRNRRSSFSSALRAEYRAPQSRRRLSGCGGSVDDCLDGGASGDDEEGSKKGIGNGIPGVVGIGGSSSGGGSGGGPSGAGATSAARDMDPKHHRTIICVRTLTIFALVTAAAVCSTLTYHFISTDEREDFRTRHADAVVKVADAFRHGLDIKTGAARTLAAVYTSRYGYNGRDDDEDEVDKIYASVAANASSSGAVEEVVPALSSSAPFPNVTLPHFSSQASGQLRLARGRAISFNPVVLESDRSAWESYASLSKVKLGANVTKIQHVDNGIFGKDPPANGTRFPNVSVPVWQIAPVDGNDRAVMFDLHSEADRMRALDDVLQHRVPTLTAILQLVQDKEKRPSSILFYPVFDRFEEYGEELHGDQQDRRRSQEAEAASTPPRSAGARPNVVGTVSIVFSWDDLLASVLPDSVRGVVAVLESSSGQQFTFAMSGVDGGTRLLGEGDLHDSKYDAMVHEVEANLEGVEDVLGDVHYLITYKLRVYPSATMEAQYVTNRPALYTTAVVLIFVCTSALFLLYDYFVKHRQTRLLRAAMRTGRIVDSMFPALVRDRLFHDDDHYRGGRGGAPAAQQTTTARPRPRLSLASAATERMRNSSDPSEREEEDKRLSGDLEDQVSALPPSIHQPLPAPAASAAASASKSSKSKALRRLNSISSKMAGKYYSSSDPRSRMNHFLSKKSKEIDEPDYDVSASCRGGVRGISAAPPPIADLFPATSIMFCDIVGFTKWSSSRGPDDVFLLLESLFWEFDVLAAERGVFKLGTIGDCYIAVTGLPDPRDDHALALAEFAEECRRIFNEVCANLCASLGSDTAGLSMRFGMHSGPVTGGVLRGHKSRFELFGDTINTASRMESTGAPDRVHVSSETAELLVEAGRHGWLRRRRDLVLAKGKGEMQTYWVKARLAGDDDDASSVSSSSREDVIEAVMAPSMHRRTLPRHRATSDEMCGITIDIDSDEDRITGLNDTVDPRRGSGDPPRGPSNDKEEKEEEELSLPDLAADAHVTPTSGETKEDPRNQWRTMLRRNPAQFRSELTLPSTDLDSMTHASSMRRLHESNSSLTPKAA